jgi:dTDP-4-dehydrorhamnose 3,5-epimerase
MFTKGPIEGVKVTLYRKFVDERGWLTELFRNDELEPEFNPTMAYISITKPGILRGPHEHVDQADLFCWVGPGDFKVSLWDNRPTSPTYRNRMELMFGANAPGSLIVPKGVVHCYRCVSSVDGWVINCPNQLFMGTNKLEAIDEIRHEEDDENPFVKDELARRVHCR